MIILAFVLYFAVMLGTGILFFVRSRAESGAKDYFLGGRKMGPWVTAMSAQASDMSAWLLMGLPGSIMAFGLGQAWIGIGLMIGTALNWIFEAKRLRKFSLAAGDSFTVPQYLSNRFLSKSHVLSVICAIVFLVSFTIYVASGFVAGATVFTTLIPSLSDSAALIIFAAILLVYTFLGGYKAVCWTDFIQGMLMLLAMVAVPIVVVASGKLDPSALSETVVGPDGTAYSFTASFFSADWTEIVSGLAWGLGYFGMPHIIVRFMSIEKPSMVRKSATVAIVWVVISLACAILIAVFGRMIAAEKLLSAGNQKLVFVELASQFFPPFITGILLSAIIAASMSTADSQLLVASSSFTTDIYTSIIRKDASAKEQSWVARVVVLVVAVIAYFIARSKGAAAQAIMNLVENAWGIFGASFGPVILLSLFWKRFTYKGAVAGIVTGCLVDIGWLIFLSAPTGIYEILPGAIAGAIAAVVATLCDAEPSDEVKALFDKAVSADFND